MLYYNPAIIIIYIAVDICLAQRDLVCVDEELECRRQQIQTLQAKLHGAEKIVVIN